MPLCSSGCQKLMLTQFSTVPPWSMMNSQQDGLHMINHISASSGNLEASSTIYNGHMLVHHGSRDRNHRCSICERRFRLYKKEHPGLSERDFPFKRTKTAYRCVNCNVFLCHPDVRPCWQEWHSETEDLTVFN
jgi:hypothetical protein